MANGSGEDGQGDQEVMNTIEAAAFLRVPPKLLAKWAKEGKVPCRKPGKGYLYSRRALLAWLAEPGEHTPGPATARTTELVG
jgi:excisionase family DNA binding protein